MFNEEKILLKKYGHTQLEITFPNHYQTSLYKLSKYLQINIPQSRLLISRTVVVQTEETWPIHRFW